MMMRHFSSLTSPAPEPGIQTAGWQSLRWPWTPGSIPEGIEEGIACLLRDLGVLRAFVVKIWRQGILRDGRKRPPQDEGVWGFSNSFPHPEEPRQRRLEGHRKALAAAPC